MNNSTCIPKIFFCDAIDSNASRQVVKLYNFSEKFCFKLLLNVAFLFLLNERLLSNFEKVDIESEALLQLESVRPSVTVRSLLVL